VLRRLAGAIDAVLQKARLRPRRLSPVRPS
jgi:hypothetical protein